MNNYYLTFNSKHKHPTNPGQSLISYWVKITVESEAAAWEVVRNRFGNKWYQLYPEYEFDETYFSGGELEHIIQDGKSEKNPSQN